VEDVGTLRVVFKGGCLGILNYTTATYEKNIEGSIAVLGTKGSVKIGGKYLDEIAEWNVENIPRPQLPPSAPPNIYKGGYQGSMSNHDKVLKNVIEVLSKGEDIAVTSAQGRITVEVMQAAHISALKNKPVDLPLKGRDYKFDMRKSEPFPKRKP
jgi:UDP-N-acetyl-2-amino-2-deoxyglucuronate dehydrogenase